jgi:hypothetical protein
VAVAGYAIETPRLLLNSRSSRFPDGLANSSGLVGKNLMVQANQAVWGIMDEEIRSYKGPPSLAITEHWNYTDTGKDFFGGYAYMSQGPLPIVWSGVQSTKRGLWGEALLREMERYNQQVGLKIVGECLPQERNSMTPTDEKDQYMACRCRASPIPVATTTRSSSSIRSPSCDKRWMQPKRAKSGKRPTTPVISTALRAWATIRAQASSMPTAGRGIFPIYGSATARFFPPWAGSIRR